MAEAYPSPTRGWGSEQRPPRSSARWLHVPASKCVEVVFLSEEPFSYLGHWFEGRMQPCVGLPECVACRYHTGTQDRVAFSVFCPWGDPGQTPVGSKVGVRMLLERLAKQRSRPKPREMDDAADLLYALTSFSTYDTLATPKRRTEKVAKLVQRLAREAVG